MAKKQKKKNTNVFQNMKIPGACLSEVFTQSKEVLQPSLEHRVEGKNKKSEGAEGEIEGSRICYFLEDRHYGRSSLMLCYIHTVHLNLNLRNQENEAFKLF